MIIVYGRLLASFFDAQAAPVPVTGRVLFTPNFSSENTADGVHLPTRLSVELDSEGRFEARLLPGDWSWRVEVIAKDQTGRTLTAPCFNFLPKPGVDRVNLADIVPLTDPVTGVPMLRGKDGVGVDAITTEAGELIFTLTDGTESRIPVPQGIPGTGVDTITLQGGELVFALSDGSETRIPAPAGAPGADAPKPNLAVGEVQTLPAGSSATAEVTGESPDFTLSLGLPAGADGKTPTITAGTVSTLPAGAPATAELAPTAGGYVLNLGLPAGASGAPGKDAATPTLAVGTVSTGTASASITGTAPNFVLNLTLPAGSKGEPGNPSAMTLVGAGRPDTPATLSTANQTAVANAAVGATFTSTDGAGTGAWAWVKTPTGWAVTYADTGWRDVTTWLVDPAGTDKASLPPSPVSRGRLLARRTTAGVELTSTIAIDFTTDMAIQLPEGWWDGRASAVSIKWDSTERKPLIPTVGYTRTLYHGGATPWVTRAGRYLIEGRWSMTAQWPTTLPGTPA